MTQTRLQGQCQPGIKVSSAGRLLQVMMKMEWPKRLINLIKSILNYRLRSEQRDPDALGKLYRN